MTAFIVTGFVAGIVYWLFAGRDASGHDGQRTSAPDAIAPPQAASCRRVLRRAGRGLAHGQVSAHWCSRGFDRTPAADRLTALLLRCIRILVALHEKGYSAPAAA